MRGMIRSCVAVLALGAGLLATPGCGPFWVDPYITVHESPLNWVEIHYYNCNCKPIRRIAVYVSGSGHVELRKGTSELVSNDFAKQSADASWSNIRTQRFTADPKRINDIFQDLVNYGLLDREKSFRGANRSSYNRFIAVKANICANTYSEPENIFEVDPDLAERLLDVIREFDNPTF